MKKRKAFSISISDLDKINGKFNDQFEVGRALKAFFETEYKKGNFKISYKLPYFNHLELRTQKNVFLEEEILEKYNKFVQDKYGLEKQKEIDNLLSQIFTSLAHEFANNL